MCIYFLACVEVYNRDLSCHWDILCEIRGLHISLALDLKGLLSAVTTVVVVVFFFLILAFQAAEVFFSIHFRTGVLLLDKVLKMFLSALLSFSYSS